ncbi:MAG: hypothetical protein KDK51_02550 [Deltaproteobacteria bacterium]|nr:hypothetical protein [Deltaproteobacteria bacterium]
MTVVGAEKFCLTQKADVIMMKNIGNLQALQNVGSAMESATIETTSDGYFVPASLPVSTCIHLNQNEATELTINQQSKMYIPFVQIDVKNLRSQYGLLSAGDLSKGTLSPATRNISTEDILQYKVDPKATILYAICPPDRSEVCTLKIKHAGKWVQDNGQDFSMQVLARSRRERGDAAKSQRLLKDGDTPQGIYQLWGSLFTTDKKFGAYPRIDIDGMRPPMYFEKTDLQNFTRVVPQAVFADYWIHEFAMAHALGRYLFRIHDNSVDPNFPNTYTTPITKKIFRASAGCLNTGDQIHKLLTVLHKLGIFSQKQIQNNQPYGRLPSLDPQNTFLVVIDQEM